jgi:hypothetical protein
MERLAELGERYASLWRELEGVRSQIKACVLNGGEEVAPFEAAKPKPSKPKPSKPKPSKPKPSKPTVSAENRAAMMEAARAAEAMITSLLSSGTMSVTEIMTATGAGRATVGDRLRRLKERGEVMMAKRGSWSLAPAPATTVGG